MSGKINIHTSYRKEYLCVIEQDIRGHFLNFCQAAYSPRKVFIIIDENVNRLHGKKIKTLCAHYFKNIHVIEVAEGEQSKSKNVWYGLVDQLLAEGIERSTPVVAAGGGVTGDVAGFAAATALRGVPLIHMPTTLLAMVDSSIGGKTGINHGKGKNLIGSFYQPDAVLSHLPFLETLPRREWIDGLSEVLKYAAISAPELFEELEASVRNFTPGKQWEQIIHHSVQIKSAVVKADTLEAGQRAVLNFGHTFGHALEKMAAYDTVSHGEAVFTGMIAATYFSKQLGASVDVARFHPFKSLYHIALPDKQKIEKLVDLMYADKKVKDGNLRLILLKKWGKPYVKETNDRKLLINAWQKAFDELNCES